MNRTDARAAAMKLVYEWEMGGDGGEDTRLGMLEIQPGENESDYMDALVEGVKANVASIDEHIAKFSRDWRVERMPRVDLSILRVAVYELLWKTAPSDVVLNEAVELSHTYCEDKTASFVNGVLGSMLRAEA